MPSVAAMSLGWRGRVRRWARVLLGRELLQGAEIEAPVVHLGADAGRRAVCPHGLGRESVVYSFGVGRDLSFELDLIDRFGPRVHTFDPTPRAIAWVGRQRLPERLLFHDYGVAEFDGAASFAPPDDPGFVSYRMVPGERAPTDGVEAPVLRLATILERLGHGRIDLLKLDVEGAEYAVLADLAASGNEVGPLLVEFHHRFAGVGRRRTRQAIRRLRQDGFRIFHVAPGGEDFGFLGAAAQASGRRANQSWTAEESSKGARWKSP